MIYRRYKYHSTNSNILGLGAADVIMMIDSRRRHLATLEMRQKKIVKIGGDPAFILLGLSFFSPSVSKEKKGPSQGDHAEV